MTRRSFFDKALGCLVVCVLAPVRAVEPRRFIVCCAESKWYWAEFVDTGWRVAESGWRAPLTPSLVRGYVSRHRSLTL